MPRLIAPELTLAFTVIVTIAACGGGSEQSPHPSTAGEPPPSVAPPATGAPPSDAHMQDGYLVAEGSPSPLTCATDADCAFDGALGADCCWTFRDMNAVVMSAAYRDWQRTWREAHCADAVCPSPPVPSEPPACLFQVHCVSGSCDNDCAW